MAYNLFSEEFTGKGKKNHMSIFFSPLRLLCVIPATIDTIMAINLICADLWIFKNG